MLDVNGRTSFGTIRQSAPDRDAMASQLSAANTAAPTLFNAHYKNATALCRNMPQPSQNDYQLTNNLIVRISMT